MWTLYDFLESGNGYKVRLTLRELGRPFIYREVDILRGESREPWFLEKNSVGQIPVLELDDGTCLSESTAILFHVAEGSPLLPLDRLSRTRVLQWMCFEQTHVDGVISRARFRRLHPDVIPTTPAHADLAERVAAGQFREDLYYRVGRPVVQIPPLRERLDEMAWLIQREISSLSHQLAASVRLVDACATRAWPGNVRELIGEIRLAAHRALGAQRAIVDAEDLAEDAGKRLAASTAASAAVEDIAAVAGDRTSKRRQPDQAGGWRAT